MRAGAIISLAIVILAACLLRSSEAVTCSVDPTVAGCTDCSNVINLADAECAAEAATTTSAPTTERAFNGHWAQSRFPWHKVKNMLLMF